ncbi:carbohydrate porin [Flavobacterium sp. N1719]|uniref:carbohydrate porin n=1 Tax=Flavobacterium sp. N1719 TaxID=2885633 RepID=UPI00222269DE|nr:carbohydrate porin [Flavobacterium sp. N1719]
MRKLLIAVFTLGFMGLYAQTKDTTAVSPFSFHGQTTVINQTKSGFKVPYSGPNSVSPDHESATSMTATFYAGVRLWKGASFYVNPEIAGGSGISSVLGIGSATNGETFRVGSTAPKLYLARLYFKQHFNLNQDFTQELDDVNQVVEKTASHRIDITVGKLSMADFFDQNSYSHDPRTQFMNWALMDAGAWDYAANTRGYTPGVVAEYFTPKNEWRYGYALLPQIANGNAMNWNVSKQFAQTLEYTHYFKMLNRPGAVRLLGFYNTARMGNYRESIALHPMAPDITAVRRYGNTKYGFAINAEQQLSTNLGAFTRMSWNDGKNETWAFTQIDNSITLGLHADGKAWHRNDDEAGVALVSSGLSKPHQSYLKSGGQDFMLGDGTLHYGREQVMECFYSADLSHHQIYLTADYQLLFNPGYNTDRKGPLNVFSVRLHYAI